MPDPERGIKIVIIPNAWTEFKLGPEVGGIGGLGGGEGGVRDLLKYSDFFSYQTYFTGRVYREGPISS